MYICPNCKTTSDTKINFCPKCGSAMGEIVMADPAPAAVEQPVAAEQPVAVAEQPVVVAEQPVMAEQPTKAPQPVINYAPIVPTYEQPAPQYSKAKSIVGMVLSIVGLFFAFLGFVYTAAAIDVEEELAFAFSFVFSFLSFPLSIVGLILSKGNANLGDTSAFVKVGKILGIIGLVLAGIMAFLGFICLTEM